MRGVCLQEIHAYNRYRGVKIKEFGAKCSISHPERLLARVRAKLGILVPVDLL